MSMTDEQLDSVRAMPKYRILVRAASFYVRAVEDGPRNAKCQRIEMAEHVLLTLAAQYSSDWGMSEADILYAAGYDAR